MLWNCLTSVDRYYKTIRFYDSWIYLIGTNPDFYLAKDCQLGNIPPNYLGYIFCSYNSIIKRTLSMISDSPSVSVMIIAQCHLLWTKRFIQPVTEPATELNFIEERLFVTDTTTSCWAYDDRIWKKSYKIYEIKVRKFTRWWIIRQIWILSFPNQKIQNSWASQIIGCWASM